MFFVHCEDPIRAWLGQDYEIGYFWFHTGDDAVQPLVMLLVSASQLLPLAYKTLDLRLWVLQRVQVGGSTSRVRC